MSMFTLFSHAGHSHELGSELEHCMPILVGAGIIIAALVIVIIMLVLNKDTPEKKKPTKSKK